MACINDTASISLVNTSGILTANVKISATGGNLISLVSDGLYAAGGGGSSVPAGTVIDFAGSATPSGYLLCDGSTANRTTQAALFAAIGTTYGAGDGSTTFTLPDARGRATYGVGTNADVNALNRNDALAVATRSAKHNSTPALNVSGISATHTLTLPNHGHAHTLTLPDHTHGATGVGSGTGQGGMNVFSMADSTGITANRQATDGASSLPTIGGAVGNPSSNPAISGGVSVSGGTIGGTIGPGGTRPSDMAGFIVVNKCIKT